MNDFQLATRFDKLSVTKMDAPTFIEYFEFVARRNLSLLQMVRKYPSTEQISPGFTYVMQRRHSSIVRRLIKFKRWYRENPKPTKKQVQAALIMLDIPRTSRQIDAKIQAINDAERIFAVQIREAKERIRKMK